jgi:hypothetical protein
VIKLIGECLTLLPAGFFDTIPIDGLTICTLLVLIAAVVVSMAAPVVVSDVPEHCAKRMCFSLDPVPADVAAASDSPMAVELPFPGEFVNGEFQVVYETL